MRGKPQIAVRSPGGAPVIDLNALPDEERAARLAQVSDAIEECNRLTPPNPKGAGLPISE